MVEKTTHRACAYAREHHAKDEGNRNTMAIIPNLSRNTWASRLQKDTWSDWCCPKMQKTWSSHRNSTNAQWNIWPTTILRWSISMVTLTHGAHRALPDYHSPKTKPTCMYMFARVVHTAHEFSHSPNPPDRKSSTSSVDGWRNRQLFKDKNQ